MIFRFTETWGIFLQKKLNNIGTHKYWLPNVLTSNIYTFKYHVIAQKGRFQLELIYVYFPPSFHLTVCCFCPVGLS